MNRNEAAYYLRSDEDDADYLRDNPMGRCPWCGVVVRQNATYPQMTDHFGTTNFCHWDEDETELENRARYQEEREESARIEETINREMRGR